MTRDFHVFYCRHRTGEFIDSRHPEPMALVHIVDLAAVVLETTGDFLGLVDEDEGLLQCMYLAREEGDLCPIRLEIPDLARHGCHIRQVSSAELQDALRHLPKRLSADAVPGLHFENRHGL